MDGSAAVTLDAVVAHNGGVVYVVLDGEGVIYHEGLAQAHVFNVPGTLIWESLDGQRDLRAIVTELVDLTGVEYEIIARDVIDAVARFIELDLAKRAGDRAPGDGDAHGS